VTIRTAQPTDYDRLAPVVSLGATMPVTAEILRERDLRDEGLPAVRLLAEERNEIVGYAGGISFPNQPKGEFLISVAVIPSQREKGVGRELLMQAEELCRRVGAICFKSQVRDDQPGSIAASERFGYRVEQHEFESAMNPQDFDETPFAGIIEKVEAEGIRFLPFSQTDGSEEARRMLHSINVLVSADVPGTAPGFDWPYEHFCRTVFEAKWFRPEGQIMAMDGDEPVGLGAIGEIGPGCFYNMITGVRREYRGRGIATALKALTLRVAKNLGGTEICANNDSKNLPMLAVNRKAGYVERPGLLKLYKVVE